ncbi:MAG: DUF1343 domain-containing protein [Bacteroidales bacterium]|jgi:uncharacterized protein YbbC (DUF1343 family)
MVKTGLEIVSESFPSKLKGKRIGLLCHAPSVTKSLVHVTDVISGLKDCKLSAIFGPQHGLYGQTQDNMIEWEGGIHPVFKVPVYSLYGRTRKPTPAMLDDMDALIIDLQDIGTRVYTYIWTVKLCLEACTEAGLPVWILDRPNPIARLPFDGPVLKKEFFSFVGGASVPLCHRMTIGEMAQWIRDKYYSRCDLNIVWMKEWYRNSLFSETGLPWVIPSPNIPALQSALVYPGTVLFEGTNVSEGRGTTIPFELFGAPYIKASGLKADLEARKPDGCVFRVHSFMPAFNKYSGDICNGLQIYVTDVGKYHPASVALEIIDAIIENAPGGKFIFNKPPYEYENNLMPFDILSGDSGMRSMLEKRGPVKLEKERWKHEIEEFRKEFSRLAFYSE